jgi:glycosyltransferase involved in cell wall biosynthesis
MIDLTIVIPCFNEEENVILILEKVKQLIQYQDFKTEIIVVDDQSVDKTFEVTNNWINTNSENLQIKLLSRDLDRRGYGAVVRHGTAFGTGRYCIFVSADAVDPIELIPEMYKEMEQGSCLIQCSRYLVDTDNHTIPFKYKFFQYFFRKGVVLATGQKILDSTYSFKMFRRSDILALGISQNRFSISPEITFKFLLTGGKITYIAGAQSTRIYGISKFNFLKEGPGYMYCLFRCYLHRLKIIYWF